MPDQATCIDIARAAGLSGGHEKHGEIYFRAPYREDKNASLRINIAKDRWYDDPAGRGGTAWGLVAAIVGCEPNDKAKVKAQLKDYGLLSGGNGNGRQQRRIVASHDYRSLDGELLFQVVRYDPKDFRQRRPDGNGGWIPNLKGVEVVPYRLNETHQKDTVFVTEGEKHADLLWNWGIPATTCPMGAGKWREQYNQHFAGKNVAILPDSDDVGRKHAFDVARHLLPVADKVKIVTLPELPEKGDVINWADAGHTKEELYTLVKETEPLTSDQGAATPSSESTSIPEPEAVPTTDEELFQELALLSPMDYDRRRKSTAKKLGVRVETLDEEIQERRPLAGPNGKPDGGQALLLNDPDPWPDAVKLGALLEDIAAVVRCFVVVPDSTVSAVSLWVVLTYVSDSFNVSPILAIISPEKRCGKTTLLKLLIALVTRALPTSNVTAATIFRSVEAFRPTLLIDEADAFMTDAEDLRGILNSGHEKSMAFVLRTTGDNHEPKAFSTWCPKAVASIGKLPDTLQDRSIVIGMRRRSAQESVERMRFDKVRVELDPLRQKIARWALDHHAAIALADPDIPKGLDDRAADNWRPLFAIADAAGADWPTKARIAATALSGARGEDDESVRTMLLMDIQDIFSQRRADRIASAEIVSNLAEREDRPWPEWKKGKPITVRQLARLLKPFEITPKTIRFAAERAKGYELESFIDPFSRYLPDRSVTSVTMKKTNTLEDFSSVTNDGNVTDRKNSKPSEINDVTDVTDEIGVSGGKGSLWEDRL